MFPLFLVALSASGADEQRLFNGKDLDGWDAAPGWWHVEDGALTAESTPEKPCKKCNYLIWKGGEKKRECDRYRTTTDGSNRRFHVGS